MLEKVLGVVTVSSPPLMNPARTWHMAAFMAPLQSQTLGQLWADGFHCHPKAVWRMCSGYPWYPEGQRGLSAILQVLTGQVTAGTWTSSFIKFVELNTKLNIFLGELDGSLREMVTVMLGDSPVPFLHFLSHHTTAVLTSACTPVSSMTSWHVHGQTGHGCFGQMDCWAFTLAFLQR